MSLVLELHDIGKTLATTTKNNSKEILLFPHKLHIQVLAIIHPAWKTLLNMKMVITLFLSLKACFYDTP